MYRAIKIGLSYQEAWYLPLGAVLDLVACDLVATGVVQEDKSEEEFFRGLSLA